MGFSNSSSILQVRWSTLIGAAESKSQEMPIPPLFKLVSPTWGMVWVEFRGKGTIEFEDTLRVEFLG